MKFDQFVSLLFVLLKLCVDIGFPNIVDNLSALSRHIVFSEFTNHYKRDHISQTHSVFVCALQF